MNGRRPHPLVVLWMLLALSPLVIWLHQEVVYQGTHQGWQFASLDASQYLYRWTRNRLLAWLAIYLVGAALLAVALRRETHTNSLAAFVHTTPGRALVPYLAVLLLLTSIFLDVADVLLLGMLVSCGFFALWAHCRSGEQLKGKLVNLMLLATTLGVVLAIAEGIMRQPSLVKLTGGSLAVRSTLYSEFHRSRSSTAPWSRSQSKSPDAGRATRVMAIGDSFTNGDWVARDEDVWPSIVEDVLIRRGHPAAVANAGASGSDTVDQLRKLQVSGWRFDPNVLVVQYTLNDTGQSPDQNFLPLLPVLGSGLRRTSSLYLPLEARFGALQAGWTGGGYDRYFENDNPGWQQSREALGAIVAAARHRGVQVLVLVFPMFDSALDGERYKHPKAHAAVASLADTLGVPVVDVREALAAIQPDPRHWWATPFDSHPGPAAHRIAGELVAEKLIELRWIPGVRAIGATP